MTAARTPLLLILIFRLLTPPDIHAADADPTPVFFEQYCTRCHDAQKTKGGLRLDQLGRDFSELQTAERWDEILLRMNAGEMPPEEEKQPAAALRASVAEWIHARLGEGKALREAGRARVNLLRLSREEYALSLRDLLGVQYDIDAPGGLNEDPKWRGFNRLAPLLTLSPSHLERYYEAAQKSVADAFPDKPAQKRSGRTDAATPRAKELLDKRGIEAPPRQLLLPGKTFGMVDVRDPGLYRVSVRLSALPTKRGRVPHMALWEDTLKRSMDGMDVDIPEDHPTTVTFTTRLPRGRFTLLNQAPGTFEALTLALTTQQDPFTHSTDRRFVLPGSYQLFDAAGRALVPLLLVDSLEWEGPLPEETVTGAREAFFPKDESPQSVGAALEAFLERCWRRPVSREELAVHEAIVHKERAAGESFRNAYLAALTGALASKNFYYLQEGSADQNRDRLSSWEFISRLSYFLWSSMPDEKLFELARNGRILEPAVMREQVQRMLADPKAAAFEEHFPKQWLQLYRVGSFPPDAELYPDHDRWLEQSMVEESRRFFREVLRENLSIQEFLNSDWTVLNPRLALHYGLPIPKGGGFQKVRLAPESHRGGLLTQASLLSLTSDGIRHRPVHRGALVLETVFGRTPPPPPPNVEPLEPTPADSPKATVRMQLAAHAGNAVCASCHNRIDPLGFAFDNFDAVGRWRDREVVGSGTGDNLRVDASGRLPSGAAFDGPDAFKRLLATEAERFAEAFTGQMATFGLRRVTTLDDHAELAAVAARARPGGYRLRDLVVELVCSDLFGRR
jgi:hypothetical protein